LSYAKWRVFKGFQLCCSYEVAPEQKARLTYDNILRLVKDPEIADPIRFLREREIVHFQRFGEALRKVQDERDSRNFYAFNPQIDKKSC
jgi:Mn-containing catalase